MIYIQAKDGSNIAEEIKVYFEFCLQMNISISEMIDRCMPVRFSTDEGHAFGFCFPDDTGKPIFYIGPIDSDVLAESPNLIDELTEQITKEEFEALMNFNKEK